MTVRPRSFYLPARGAGKEFFVCRADPAMLKFEQIGKEEVVRFAPFFRAQRTHLSDFSLGFQFMWHKFFTPAFAVFEDCLVLKELFAGKVWFHYPLSLTGDGEAELRAVGEIERYCRDNEVRLHFTNVKKSAASLLVQRYADVSFTNIRRWRDYLYEAENFRTYAGSRYAGQRNHVNKFKKLCPDWTFERYDPAREDELVAFLREYESVQRAKSERYADEEMDEVYALVPKIVPFGLHCGVLRAGGRIVACSIGETCGDMLVIHVEKALHGVEGAYPMVAQQFALAFSSGVRYLNRMDDAGDMGLRKSKLQYLPCEVVGKYNVTPRRPIDLVSHLPEIASPRLTLAPLRAEDVSAYARLAGDAERNRYWGYDWREDAPDAPDASYFAAFAEKLFREKMEMPLAVYRGGTLVGEVVLHRFGYAAEAEIGVRLLPEYEGCGYAAEALSAYMGYAFEKLELERVEAKHFVQNVRSGRSLLLAGMKRTGEDGEFVYYEKTPKM